MDSKIQGISVLIESMSKAVDSKRVLIKYAELEEFHKADVSKIFSPWYIRLEFLFEDLKPLLSLLNLAGATKDGANPKEK